LITIDAVINEDDPVSVQLKHFPLESAPPYVALSYTWGRPSPSFPIEWDDHNARLPIKINGLDFKVRLNLHSALKTLRNLVHKEAIVWIDALCINQDSEPEKNHFVPRMTEIYASSQATAVWLGSHDETSRMAFSKLKSLSKSWTERPDALKQFTFAIDNPQALPDFSRIAEADFAGEHAVEQWNTLRAIWERAWWRRTWIFQEFTVSPTVFFHCGDSFVLGEDVYNVLITIGQYQDTMAKLEVPEKDFSRYNIVHCQH
jgi:hypothetical protein